MIILSQYQPPSSNILPQAKSSLVALAQGERAHADEVDKLQTEKLLLLDERRRIEDVDLAEERKNHAMTMAERDQVLVSKQQAEEQLDFQKQLISKTQRELDKATVELDRVGAESMQYMCVSIRRCRMSDAHIVSESDTVDHMSRSRCRTRWTT